MFSWREEERKIKDASTHIPPEELPRFYPVDLADEQLKMTDRYCDELFRGYDSVVFPGSRLVCDPERFRDDVQESMPHIGIGAIYVDVKTAQKLTGSYRK